MVQHDLSRLKVVDQVMRNMIKNLTVGVVLTGVFVLPGVSPASATATPLKRLPAGTIATAPARSPAMPD
ncbi:hypothetical protein ACFVTC_18995 [Streptomyces sp. NPDC057950]|uniref:hypothetical protein n=1 Tax=Streptomyces sp. NPDC057950 TaxID=3346288 RepID=UPI0036E2D9DB